MRNALIFVLLLSVHSAALAYIGPGLGAGALGVVLGILASIVLAIVAIVWYPIKRLLKRKSGTGSRDKKDRQPEQEP